MTKVQKPYLTTKELALNMKSYVKSKEIFLQNSLYAKHISPSVSDEVRKVFFCDETPLHMDHK